MSCPSCPVGNSAEVQNPRGFMELELLDSIMRKATSECKLSGVGLFNWTEPLLHPKLPELVSLVQSYGVPCGISSNLNILKNIDQLLSSNPHIFRISLSGFTQEVYGSTHRGGNIERVKDNMRALAEAKKRTNSSTYIHVVYHRYLTNLEEEDLMRKFAESLGFGFDPVWAFMMPLEKILAYVNSIEENSNSPALTADDYKTINKLALPLKEALDISSKYSHRPCILRDQQIAMDFQGNVQLCCGVFDSQKYTIASYLTTPLSDIQATKYSDNSQKTCSNCMKHGVHVYGTYGGDELNELAIRNIMSNSPIRGLKMYLKELVVQNFIGSSKKKFRVIKRLIRSALSSVF
ncbi:radical SAM protein [Pseudanabaena yagii GIHE-NHR1]|uniref:Radical SAM protein n=1 Tax=Pseudanabaena yagii GIHE-NHR1 TaxID=2722753 RepID=A0ABX1M067_9CYAN|nr:radical SAM protein [Pseudanabaena yagii GIHE-NHR1]